MSAVQHRTPLLSYVPSSATFSVSNDAEHDQRSRGKEKQKGAVNVTSPMFIITQ
jgi:hypothetical protein